MMNKENKMLPLLYEIRMDALKKSSDAAPDERIFYMIHYMKMLNWVTNVHGCLAVSMMAEMIEDIMPAEFNFKGKILFAADLFSSAYAVDELIEILTSRYWANNYQKTDALMYYMLILTMVKLHNRISNVKLEELLKSCLNDKNIEEYEKYKVRFDKNEVKDLFESNEAAKRKRINECIIEDNNTACR